MRPMAVTSPHNIQCRKAKEVVMHHHNDSLRKYRQFIDKCGDWGTKLCAGFVLVCGLYVAIVMLMCM